jgi:hypothetical protein
MWWHMPEIPAFRDLRQEDHKVDAYLGYVVRLCLKKKKKKKKKKRKDIQIASEN